MNYIHPYLQIKKTDKKGLGVFTLNEIEANTLVEISPVLVLSEEDTQLIHQTKLHDYYFSWGEKQKKSAIALGYLSLYNHLQKPNCYQEFDFEKNNMSIFTKENIAAGEELSINYNMDEDKKLWFKVE